MAEPTPSFSPGAASAGSTAESRARVLVAGASGFAGALAARLVWRHPSLELTAVTSRSEAGLRHDAVYPRHRVPLTLEELDLDGLKGVDAAIVAYPHGAAAPVVAEFRAMGVKVVDLSADFRLSDQEVYAEWYGEHGAPQIFDAAVYGLTEFNRQQIAGAGLVANPGCYPTAAILALAPLAQAGLIAGVVVDAKSGVSGAGRGGGEAHHFSSVDENFKPYGVDGHRHLPEIRQELAGLGASGPLTFTPHLLPLDQGLLASCYVTLAREVTEAEVLDLYRDAYAGERFVEITDTPPGVADVRETNVCRVHVHHQPESGRVLAFSAIDNLWKGAAGQAVQNLNLMLGLDEWAGLE